MTVYLHSTSTDGVTFTTVKYRILKQPEDGGKPQSQWDDTGEIFDADEGYVNDYLIELQAKTGVCHAAEAIEL